MLDKKTLQMLQVACLLEESDLDEIRTPASIVAEPALDTAPDVEMIEEDDPIATSAIDDDSSRGERERQRSRESKVSTTCLGQAREPHAWWPLHTELTGRIGAEVFTARVVENPHVKSGRSLLITSGAANGRLCLTPTRAAIEATEAYRQANNLGRGGGITNGWSFWMPKS